MQRGSSDARSTPVRQRRRLWRTAFQAILVLAYPAALLIAWHWDRPRYLGAMLFVMLWLQRWIGSGVVANALRRLTTIDWCVAGVLSTASAAIVITNSELCLRCYPALVNLGLLVAFGATLARGPSMIEKIARLREPALSVQAVQYTRHVTLLWCSFFIVNSAFSLYTALQWSRAAWSLYNGVFSYIAIGLLLGGEVVYRHLFVLPRTVQAERI